MTRKLCLFLFFAAAAWPADTDFNGRWDITVHNSPRRRAWWLEVQGAGTPAIQGKFIGFPGGDLNVIQHIWIDHGDLAFTFDAPTGARQHQEYRAHFVKGHLEGTFQSGDSQLTWTAARAPEITDVDDSSWHSGPPVDLLSHGDLSNWHGMTADASSGWSIENGILKGNGAAPDLISNAKFWNFQLHAEYRTPPKSNSGIGLRGRYEVQILEDYGRPLDRHSNAALYSRIIPTENVTKPAGEWQTYDIRLVGRHVTITLNGKTVTQGIIDGLTAIACDPDEGLPGPIMLQGDHGPVEFRSLVLTPLVK